MNKRITLGMQLKRAVISVPLASENKIEKTMIEFKQVSWTIPLLAMC